MKNLNKKDREIMDIYLENVCKVYQYCFNPNEYTSKYLSRFASNRFESAIYNNEIGKLKLNILGGEITNVSEGKEDMDKETYDAIQRYFITNFKKFMKQQLVVRADEIKAEKQAEKQAKDELKKSKNK